jgi:cell division protein FtsA
MAFLATPPTVALEIGTTTVRALVGESRDDGHLMITGLGESPSRGVRKGDIVDLDNATACVRSALTAAEENSRVDIYEVHLVVSGGQIMSLVNRGSVPILSPGHEIADDDVRHVMDTARAVTLPADRQVLHTVAQHFHVDDQPGVINPVGMEGAKLSLDMLVVHGVLNRLRNLVKVAHSARVEVVDVAFSGLCAALAVLTPEEKEAGVLVVDLGGGTTDFVAYANDVIATAGAFGVGGDHVTNDIAYGLRMSLTDAERLKESSGSAVIELAARSQRISLPGGVGEPDREARLSDLNTIMHARMDETLGVVRRMIEGGGLLRSLGAGVVLTGGGAHLRQVDRLAEKVFGLPCRIGSPRGVGGLKAVTEGPEFASVVGAVRWGLRNAVAGEKAGGSLKSILKKLFRK